MIYLFRHAETVWNREQRLQGRLDSPLTLWGVRLAISYGEWLRGMLAGGPEPAIYSSPLGRAHQTAVILADAIGAPAARIRTDPLLVEHDVGDWAGRSWEEIEATSGDSRERLKDWDHRPPNGETRREMLGRARRWIARSRAGRVSIVVSHGGFSRAFRGAYLGLGGGGAQELPTHVHGRVYLLESGSVTELRSVDEPPPAEALLG